MPTEDLLTIRLSMRVTSACGYVFRHPTDLDEPRPRQYAHRSSRRSPDIYTPGIMGLLKRGGDREGYTELLGHPGVDAGVDRSEYVVVGALLVEPVLQRSGL